MSELLSNLDFGTVITVVISGFTMFFGAFWIKAKGKLKIFVQLIKSFYELSNELEKALEDDKITKSEMEEIKADWHVTKENLKMLFEKEKK